MPHVGPTDIRNAKKTPFGVSFLFSMGQLITADCIRK